MVPELVEGVGVTGAPSGDGRALVSQHQKPRLAHVERGRTAGWLSGSWAMNSSSDPGGLVQVGGRWWRDGGVLSLETSEWELAPRLVELLTAGDMSRW